MKTWDLAVVHNQKYESNNDVVVLSLAPRYNPSTKSGHRAPLWSFILCVSFFQAVHDLNLFHFVRTPPRV
jgi:hypothetical protein